MTSVCGCDEVGPCFSHKLRTIQFGKGDTSDEVGRKNAWEKKIEKDLKAYKTMREQGLQPKQTTDSAELAAKATTQFEIDHGIIVSNEVKRTTLNMVQEGIQLASTVDWKPSAADKGRVPGE